MSAVIHTRKVVSGGFPFPDGIRVLCHLELPFGPEAFAPGHFDIECRDSIVSVAQIAEVASAQTAPWLHGGYVALRVRPMFTLDLGKDEVPKGTMLNTYKKGVEACLQGHAPNSYPGEAGTGIHTIWLKGWFRTFIGRKLADLSTV